MLKRYRTRLILATTFFLLITTTLIGGYLFFQLPDVSRLKSEYPVLTYRKGVDRPEVRWEKVKPPNWRRIDQVSEKAIGAIIVSEDWAFYEHKGADWNQIKEVVLSAFKKGELKRGASTITQQVVKNVFLNRRRSAFRKLVEIILAQQIEESFSKDKILEFYLNIAEWGRGIVGIQEASNYYFGKDSSMLGAKEGAFLAMLLPSPHRYAQSYRQKKPTLFARNMMSSILRKMVQAGYLAEEEALIELEQPLPFEQVNDEEFERSFVEVEDLKLEELRPERHP